MAPYCFICSSWNIVDISLLHCRKDPPMLKLICLLPYVICLGLTGFAQTKDGVRSLEPDQLVEREIVGGQTHTYQITLVAGRLMRVGVTPQGVNVSLTLNAPDGKQVATVNFARFAGPESLSWEAAVGGDYRLVVSALGPPAGAGAYQARLEVKAAASAQDRQQITIERLLTEAIQLNNQGAKAAPRIIELAQQALVLCRESGDQAREAYALFLIGSAWYIQERYEKAAEYYEPSTALYRRLKYRGDEGFLLSFLGDSYSRVKQNEKAIEILEQALRITREIKDRVGEGITLGFILSPYTGMNRHNKVIEYGEQALSVAREVKNRRLEADCLNSLGSSAYHLDDLEKARDYFEQALAIARELKSRVSEGGFLLNLGNVYSKLSRLEKSIEYFEQSLAIQREMKSRPEQALALTCLANAYKSLRDYDKAITYLEQSLAIYREFKARSNEGLTLISLGEIYDKMGRHDKAIELLEQSLAIMREVKDRRGEGTALAQLGIANVSLKRFERGIESLERALTIGREVKDRTNEAAYLDNLGDAWLEAGRYDTAVGHYQQALAISRELKTRAREAQVLSKLAQTELKRGNPGQARALIEESLKITESLRSDIFNQELRASFFATAQGRYQFYVDLLMQMRRDNPGQGYDALAVENNERARARNMLELLTEAGVDIRQGVDAALLERERTLSRRLNARAQLLTRSDNSPEQAAALKEEISALESEYQQTQVEIRRTSPRYAALTQPQPLRLGEIQRQLDEETVVLEYSLGDERSFLWAITHNSLTSHELPGREQIEQAAQRALGLLTARGRLLKAETAAQRRARLAEAGAQLPEAVRRLSQTLLSPVAAELGNKRLAIVADGALQYLPFAALPAPQTKGASQRPPRPLIADHEIINLPSASTLAVQRREQAGRQTAPKTLAVIADPVFSASDDRMKSLALGSPQADSAPVGVEATRIIEHLAENSTAGAAPKLVIPRLPFTRREADQIAAIASSSSGPSGSSGAEILKAVDFKANRQVAFDPELSQYRYVHFATHGLIDSERPGLSALALSLVDEQGRPQDGFLRAYEIYNLNLPADLVVLSACQTRLGKDVKGEGLVGLTRGFMYAGAARVVVSLWNVNDKATSELMAKFYQKMLKDGQSPAAALRSAQVEMWRSSQWQSPYFWAAFVLQGEWK